MQVRNLEICIHQIKMENKAKLEELEAKAELDEAKIKKNDNERKHYEMLLANERKEFEVQLAREREANRKLITENLSLKDAVGALQQSNSNLEDTISLKDRSIAKNESLIEAKSKVLQQKDIVISDIGEHLSRVREFLTSKQQQIRLTWKQCADLPMSLCGANAVTVNGKVYCGDESNNVYCYDLPHNNWTILPPPPVSRSTLAQVNGELVAIGGDRKSNIRKTNDLYSYIEKSRRWKQILPSMPTARLASGVFNLQSALVVAGGCIEVLHNTDAVEILDLDTLQWYKTCPLSSNCLGISTAVVDNRCYVLGGHNYPEHLNQAMYASVDDLLDDTVAAKCSRGERESIWKIITDTPAYEPAAGVLAGCLLAIGGSGTSSTGGDRKEVYMYSPSTNSWIYINDLPAPLSGIAVTSLSSTELLVIGGWSIDGKVKSVYKSTLQLKL